MELLNQGVAYLLSFKPYVLLPVILLLFSLAFRIRFGQALKASLTIGIGFIGIFLIFDYFVAAIGPAVQALIARTGLNFNVLDVGWTPLAAITWSYTLAPLLIVLIMVTNFILLALKLTRTVNIDIWNYWHFIFMGALVYETTGSITLSIVAATMSNITILKLADWSAAAVKDFSGLKGISISTLSGVVYYPLGIVGDWFIDRIPGLRNLNANPESIKTRLGILGEPMVIGFVIGLCLGIGAGYDVKQFLELAFQIAAVILILPMMSGLLGQGLLPISEGMKNFIKRKFPDLGETYIGLDVAVILGNTSVVVTGLLLMPVALLAAFLLPGVKFIPLGDLANTLCAVSMVAVATKGNVVRSFLIGLPIIIGKLYAASSLARLYTDLSYKSNFSFKGYDGIITSFLDGGNLFRFWELKLFQGHWAAFLALPLVALLLYITASHASKKTGKYSKGTESFPLKEN